MTALKTAPPELLAPAGEMESLRAAVANGADAVYFGLTRFSARGRAVNFPVDELPGVLDYLHDRQVRGYIAFNTLLFDDELAEASTLLEAVARAGADALIVQDLGVARLARRIAPALPLHASTQMTLSEAGGIELLRAEGIRRVILPRELTLDQIRAIRGGTDVELEVFVHGALCVSYSGQCLASLTMGGRSANRGECAQPCRLPYQLFREGRALAQEARHLLSPNDLCALPLIPQLCAAGVAGFKIEGRLKSPHYVACVTRAYRQAIDEAMAGRAFTPSEGQLAELAQVFNRGAGTGYFAGVNHGELVDGESPKHRGIRLGTVRSTSRRRLTLALEAGLPSEALPKPGDGIVFGALAEEEPEGGRIYSVGPLRAGEMELELGEESSLARVKPGAMVWKSDDPALRKRLEQTWSQPRFDRPIPLRATVAAVEGRPLHLTLSDDAGHAVEIRSEQSLQRAQKHAATSDLLREQLGRLGGTPFELAGLECGGLGEVMVPKSVLNEMRRRGVEELLALRHAGSRHPVADPDALKNLLQGLPAPAASTAPPRLRLLVRTIEQAEVAFASRDETYLDLPSLTGMQAAALKARAAGLPFLCATRRMYKPEEMEHLDRLLELRPAGLLVRNLAALAYARKNAPRLPLIADFSLNAASALTLGQLRDWGVARAVPSYDVDSARLPELARRAGAFLEVVLYGHTPMFHMEHCPRAAFLRCEGNRHEGCRAEPLRLRDRLGVEHEITADDACRTTVWHGEPAASDARLPELLRAGVRDFRIELLHEDAAAMQRITARFARLLGLGWVKT